jgi:hypothetical protein
MFHLIWYILVGLIAGAIAKSVMHTHITIFLDDCARHHWIDHRWRRHAHVFAAGKRTIPSRRPHFFHTRRDPGSLYLLQIADSLSSRVTVFRVVG